MLSIAAFGPVSATAFRPAGAYSLAFVGPNKPSVGAPAAAARCMSPESLPTNKLDRDRNAAISGRLRRPIRSIASGNSANTLVAIAASASPGPAITAGTAPGICVSARPRYRAPNPSAGQTFGIQLAVGASTMTGLPAGSNEPARDASSVENQTTGSGTGSRHNNRA